MSIKEPYTKTHPFKAKIKERYSLCGPTSIKNTQHIVLDLSGSGLIYEVGDSIGVFPVNDPQIVENTLRSIHATGEEEVVDRQGATLSFRQFLTTKANISEFSKKFIGELAARQTEPNKKSFLKSLLLEENKELLRKYHHDHEVWDALEEQQIPITALELTELLMPLLPRLYSISSSQLAYPDEVHLTVALTHYETNGIERFGVCTHYLCNLCPIGESIIPIYIQPHHGFTLPKESAANLIMIGPGTGVAPFRAFMQERAHKGHKGKNWLFFGEWTKDCEFFYEEEWNAYVAQNLLKMELAFSRDQAHKIYVQDRMQEQGDEFFKWLEEGAYVYVCGDAKHMAKDVDKTLQEILKTYGKLNDDGVKAYMKHLRAEKRYLRDVY